jgi:hypothetical protein
MKYKEIYKMWQATNMQKKLDFQASCMRQQDVSNRIEDMNYQLMQKMENNKRNVEKYQEDQKHKFMIIQEERKLREQDMKKVQMRHKRLKLNEKIKIVNQE